MRSHRLVPPWSDHPGKRTHLKFHNNPVVVLIILYLAGGMGSIASVRSGSWSVQWTSDWTNDCLVVGSGHGLGISPIQVASGNRAVDVAASTVGVIRIGPITR